MSEKLSEENAAILRPLGALWTPVEKAETFVLSAAQVNMILNAARAEARPAVDREAVARWFAARRAADTDQGDPKVMPWDRDDADAILALLSPVVDREAVEGVIEAAADAFIFSRLIYGRDGDEEALLAKQRELGDIIQRARATLTPATSPGEGEGRPDDAGGGG